MIPETFTSNLRQALAKARNERLRLIGRARSLEHHRDLEKARADRAEDRLRQFAGASASTFMDEPLRLCINVARFRSPEQQRLAIEQAIATLRRDAIEALRTAGR